MLLLDAATPPAVFAWLHVAIAAGVPLLVLAAVFGSLRSSVGGLREALDHATAQLQRAADMIGEHAVKQGQLETRVDGHDRELGELNKGHARNHERIEIVKSGMERLAAQAELTLRLRDDHKL